MRKLDKDTTQMLLVNLNQIKVMRAKLYEFFQDTAIILTNTWCKLPERRLYTWVHNV